MRRVGTRAAVIDVLERFDDGRLNVVVEGRERFELQELTSGRTFQTGDVEPLVDDGRGHTPEQVERTLAVLRRVAELADAELDEEVLTPSGDTPSFELAARVTLEPKLKQQLLEQRSEPARLEHLAELLEAAAKALKDRRAAAKLASGNGRLRRG
jgi:Lon protease-like protein